MKRTVTVKELKFCLTGSCFLGSGGGGNITLASDWLNNKEIITESDKITLQDVEDCDPDLLTAVVFFMGAPECYKKEYQIKPVVQAFVQLQKKVLATTGKKIGYLIPGEIGAMNMLVPFLVANQLNKQNNGQTIAVINGDGSGRAVPELQMTTFAAQQVSASPAVVSNSDGFYIAVEIGNLPSTANSAQVVESILRPVLALPEFNEVGGLALWLMNRSDLQKSAIRNTVACAIAMGSYLQNTAFETINQSGIKSIYQMINPALAVKVIDNLIFDSINESTAGGFDQGAIVLKTAGDPDLRITAIIQNETLLVWLNTSTSPLVKAPESCALLFNNSWKALSNGDIDSMQKDLKNCRVKMVILQAVPQISEGVILNAYQAVLQKFGYYGS